MPTRPQDYPPRQRAALDEMNDLQAWVMGETRQAVDRIFAEAERRMARIAGLVEHQTKNLHGTGRLSPVRVGATSAPANGRERRAS